MRLTSYLALVMVSTKKFEKRGHAFLVVEHFGREVPIEEFNSISDRFGESWFRKGCGERFEIQLENEISIGAASGHKTYT